MKNLSKVVFVSFLLAGSARADVLTVLDGNGNYAGSITTAGPNAAYANGPNGEYVGSIYGTPPASAVRSVDTTGILPDGWGELPPLKR